MISLYTTLNRGLLCAIIGIACSIATTYQNANQDIELLSEEEFTAQQATHAGATDTQTDVHLGPKKIKDIIITRYTGNQLGGNPLLPEEAIRNSIPYTQGEVFKAEKTNALIKKLYALGGQFSYFEQIEVMGEDVDDEHMNLHVITTEKPRMQEVVLTGNKKVTDKEIKEKIALESIKALNTHDLERIQQILKKLYREKDFHNAAIATTIEDVDGNTTAKITIDENKKTLIKRVFFKGNDVISSKKLRNVIFTREDWILGFTSKAGSYHPDNLEIDKRIIENFYKTHGYLKARVTKVDIVNVPEENCFLVTFHIHEGQQYRIASVQAQGNDLLTQEEILERLPVRSGQIYSERTLHSSIELLRKLWGNCGYIFADIEPLVLPNDKTLTVDVAFNSELGERVYLNRINIKGNKKTREKVIRRRLSLMEGNLLTNTAMDHSKNRVELLSYFDKQNGANWKINRLDNGTADADLIVKEVNTGRIGGNIGVGGSPKNMASASQSFRVGGAISDINLMGTGIRFNFGGEWSKEEWSINFNMADPWFMDRPILAELDLHVIKSDYSSELKDLKSFDERNVGGFIGSGFIVPSYYEYLKETACSFRLGFEDITYSQPPQVIDSANKFADLRQIIARRRFQEGGMVYLHSMFSQDLRNHETHPTSGYRWAVDAKLAFNAHKGDFGFFKFIADASWYTPLIDNDKLIFGIHGFAGYIHPFEGKVIPWRELFHVGGPATVRGFLFGQIGPQFDGSPIGGRKAFFWNAELIFPITADFNIKGAFFWDGGAGWDTPTVCGLTPEQHKTYTEHLHNDKFDLRQAIGFGIRMQRPSPIKIDWGFKLDRRKGEKHKELHFSAYREF